METRRILESVSFPGEDRKLASSSDDFRSASGLSRNNTATLNRGTLNASCMLAGYIASQGPSMLYRQGAVSMGNPEAKCGDFNSKHGPAIIHALCIHGKVNLHFLALAASSLTVPTELLLLLLLFLPVAVHCLFFSAVLSYSTTRQQTWPSVLRTRT